MLKGKWDVRSSSAHLFSAAVIRCEWLLHQPQCVPVVCWARSVRHEMKNVRAPPLFILPASFIQKFPNKLQHISYLRVGVISHTGSSQRYGEWTNKSPCRCYHLQFQRERLQREENDRKRGFCTQNARNGRETMPDDGGRVLTGVERWCISGNYYVCALWVPNLSWRTQLPAQGVCHFAEVASAC